MRPDICPSQLCATGSTLALPPPPHMSPVGEKRHQRDVQGPGVFHACFPSGADASAQDPHGSD